MFVRDILNSKGNEVVTTSAETSLRDILRLFKKEKIGCVVVARNDGELLGTVSERDVCHALADLGTDAVDLPAETVMSGGTIVCAPDDTVSEVGCLMTSERRRHVVVLQGGRLAGIVSIGDIVKSRLDECLLNEEELRAYIVGARYRAPNA